MNIVKIIVLILSFFFCPHVFAAYAVGLGQAPQYPMGFKSFRYVNAEAPKGGVLSLPVSGGFDTLNPFTLKGDHEAGVIMLSLDTLMEKSLDEPFTMYGLLAQDIQVAPDGLSVTFHLNPKAKFQNGDAVLAKDVASSFYALTQDKAATPIYRFYWADVAKVETPQARTVVFRFKKPNAELHMILGELPVFSHKSYLKGLAEGANRLPIGSGPYSLVKAEGGRLSEFKRNKDYWAQDLPVRKGRYNFDVIRFKYYKDESVRIEGVKGGQYDFVQENIARNWARAYPDEVLKKRNLSKHEWQHANTAGMQGFVMNLRRFPFNDVRVRQAMVESFDFESINNRLFYGLYRRSNSFFTNSMMAATGKPRGDELLLLNTVRHQLPREVLMQNVPEPSQVDSIIGVRPHLLKAQSLLQQAGYRYQNGMMVDLKGKPLVFEFLTSSKAYERVVAKWQRDLQKIGVQLKIRTVDSAVYQKRMNHFDYDMTVVVYGNSESPGNEQFNYFSCAAAKADGSKNWAGICQPAIEVLLKQFEQFTNRRQLMVSAQALDRVIRHQYIIVPNWFSDKYRVIYHNKLGMPSILPKYYSPMEWMISSAWKKS